MELESRRAYSQQLLSIDIFVYFPLNYCDILYGLLWALRGSAKRRRRQCGLSVGLARCDYLSDAAGEAQQLDK